MKVSSERSKYVHIAARLESKKHNGRASINHEEVYPSARTETHASLIKIAKASLYTTNARQQSSIATTTSANTSFTESNLKQPHLSTLVWLRDLLISQTANREDIHPKVLGSKDSSRKMLLCAQAEAIPILTAEGFELPHLRSGVRRVADRHAPMVSSEDSRPFGTNGWASEEPNIAASQAPTTTK